MFQLDIYFLINKFDTLTNRNMEIAGLFKKDFSKVITSKKFVTLDKAKHSKEILSNTQVFNSCFVNKIKNPGTYKFY